MARSLKSWMAGHYAACWASFYSAQVRKEKKEKDMREHPENYTASGRKKSKQQIEKERNMLIHPENYTASGRKKTEKQKEKEWDMRIHPENYTASGRRKSRKKDVWTPYTSVYLSNSNKKRTK